MLSHSETLLRLFLAALLGGVIGFERERLSWAAGLRTHMLVCTGACLVMIVSAFGFADILGTPGVMLDPSRMAAQVVSGIGFLGAGAILLRGEQVRGITTAASLWTVAGIGLAIGGGMYFGGITATAIIFIILAGIKPLEERYRASHLSTNLQLQVTEGELSLATLNDALGGRTSKVKQFIVRHGETTGTDMVSITLSPVSPKQTAYIIADLRKLPCVQDIQEVGN
jgi:putative Mg2+ transporter-C (MgtC) family protein